MSNESKSQEWFYLKNETWNGPFYTPGLKELVKKGFVDPNTLLRIGIASVPIKAHQVKSLFPNYQGDKPATALSIKNEGVLIIPNDVPTLIGGALILVFVLGILIFGLTQSDKKMTADSDQNVFQVSHAEGIASIEKQMIIVRAGGFMMGDQSDRLQVTLTKPFYMGKYEVTQEQWESVMGNNPSQIKGSKYPVTDVSWKDCQEFIKKLNAKTNGCYRLPTEAEWEYACRAGTTTAYSVGNCITKADANIGDVAAGSIKAVGSYKANGFGLYDMHGNVWEWCEDWMADYPEGAVTDLKGPATGKYRVMRGGSFYLFRSSARSSLRTYVSPSVRDYDFGFRLARTAL